MRAITKKMLFVTWMVVAAPVVAAPCAGFTDVDSLDSFCPNVEWMKNRSITLGCTSSLYCPGASVSRLQMAAFMNRLGNALEPVLITRAESSIAANLNASAVICQTTPYAVVGYPRVATATTMMYHTAGTVQNATAQVVYSIDNGSTWNNFGAVSTRAANPANAFATQSPVAGPLILQPGASVRFGLQSGFFGSALTTTDAGCEMTARLDSHTGVSSPYDSGPRRVQVNTR